MELEEKLTSQAKESAYFALSMAKTPEEAAARKAQFLRLPTVERVDEIATRFPANVEEKRPIIERIRNCLAGLPERPPIIPVASPTELGQMLSAVRPLMPPTCKWPSSSGSCRRFAACWASCRRRNTTPGSPTISSAWPADLLGRLHLLRSVANPEPPQLSDLPAGLVSRFVGRNGSHLLRIYVKGDFWDTENMRQFVAQVRSVDPDVTGNPVQIYEASGQMRRSFEHAALYALAAILPVVFLNFGSLGLDAAGDRPAGRGDAADVRPDGDPRHSAERGQHDRPVADAGNGHGKRRAHHARLPQPARAVPHERVDGRGRGAQHADDDGRVRRADHRRPSRAPEPGPDPDDRHGLLPVQLAGDPADAAGLADLAA